MTPRVKRGLEVAKDLLRRRALLPQMVKPMNEQSELLETIEWIAHQQAIDERRRKKRR